MEAIQQSQTPHFVSTKKKAKGAPKPEKTKEELLNDLMPSSIVVKTDDGGELRVAMNKDENNIMSMILAAQLRAMIQRTIKTYEEKEAIPSPRELRDLAAAVKEINESSGAIYDRMEPLPTEKQALPPAQDDDADFSKLTVMDPVKEPIIEAGPMKPANDDRPS